MYKHHREAEKFLDVLGDIGGFYELNFGIFFAWFFSFYNRIAFETHVSSSIKVDTRISTPSKRPISKYISALSKRLKSNQNPRINKPELLDLI